MKIIKHLGFIILLLATTTTFAQPAQKKKEKIKALKIGFLTEQLDLTPAESEKFWPIYNHFQAAKKSLMSRPLKSKVENMSDAELNQLLQDQLDRQEQVIALRRKLIQDLKPVLPLKKIVMLEFAEKKFKRELLSRMRKKKGIKAKQKGKKKRI